MEQRALAEWHSNGDRAPPQAHRFVLRLPMALHELVREAATRHRRSINAEIVARLEHSLVGIPTDSQASAVEPELFPYLETTFRGELSEQENALLLRYRRLSAAQQAALLHLLGGEPAD